jgi:hypothetical protein
VKDQKTCVLCGWRQAPNIRSVHGLRTPINVNHEDATYCVCGNVVKPSAFEAPYSESRSHALNSDSKTLNTYSFK